MQNILKGVFFMKKTLALVLAILMVLALAACGDEDTAAPTQAPASTVPASLQNDDDIDYDALANLDETEAPEPTIDVDAVSQKLSVEKFEQTVHQSGVKDGIGVTLLVTNNSDVTCDLTAKAVFYDKDDIIVDTQEVTEHAVAPGTTVCMHVGTTNTVKYDYTVTPKAPSGAYLPVDKDLTVDVTPAVDKDGLIFSVTNNSSLPAEPGGCYILYFSGSELVRVDQCAPVGEDDRTIPAGATAKAKDEFGDLVYDSYKYYFHYYAEADTDTEN